MTMKNENQRTLKRKHRHLFIFGIGYTGKRAALAFKRAGYTVSGSVQEASNANQLLQTNIYSTVVVLDLANVTPKDLANIDNIFEFERVTDVLISVPPKCGLGSDPVLNSFESTFSKHATSLKWVGYLSTIAVYGNVPEGLVKESAELKTKLPRGLRRIEAEKAWLKLEGLIQIQIFRLAGIYGPGRGTLEKLRRGMNQCIDLPGRRFNSIHVEDIATILLQASLDVSSADSKVAKIYNVCDDCPCSLPEKVRFASNLLGVKMPPLVSWEEGIGNMSSMAISFYEEGRTVSNSKVKKELGIQMKFPSFKEGLIASLSDEGKNLNPLKQDRAVLVLNTGSLRCVPYLDLQRIRNQIAASFRLDAVSHVMVASARHSNKIHPSELGVNDPALIAEEALRLLAESFNEIYVLPLFFGPSKTITEFLPSLVNLMHEKNPKLIVKTSSPLVTEDDDRIAKILQQFVLNAIKKMNISRSDGINVIVVDHGSPTFAVHESREVVSGQLQKLLGPAVAGVSSASMELGDKYSFNEPMLEDAIKSTKNGCVIVALMFLSNGRHAGQGGDIEDIITRSQLVSDSRVVVTPSIGYHPLLGNILLDRYEEVSIL